MKKIFYIFMALLLVSCGDGKIAGVSNELPKENSAAKTGLASPAVTSMSVIAQAERGRYREGELLVKFRPDVTAKSAEALHQGSGAVRKGSFGLVPNLELVALRGISVKDAIAAYMSDPRVEYAEPNYIRRATSTVPNDLYFNPQQWSLNNTGTFAHGTPGADIKMPLAWDITRGSNAVIVAVLDSGVDYTHPDLVNNIWTNPGETNCTDGVDNDGNGFVDDCRGWDFVNADNDPIDDFGHGTHVAGTVGAATNNGTGIAGVMWNVRLMPLKMLDSEGFGTTADEIAAIQYAVAKGAKIMNASFSGSEFSNAERDAIVAANNAGVLLIAASGNGGDDSVGDNIDLAPEYPAGFNLPNIISVAATDQNDRRASFSNFGPNSVHVAAPGVYVLSTITPGLSFSLCTGSPFVGYNFCSGTSMAAPHVSGLAGLLYSYYTGFTYSQIRATILRYVDILPDLTGWIKTNGRVNAFSALSSLLQPTNLSAAATSSSSITISWTDNATGEDEYIVERKTGGSFAQIASLGPNSTSYTDSSLAANTTYTYRVRAANTIPANSFYSNEASATTPSTTVQTTAAEGGGGGCSIGAQKNAPTAFADALIMLLPLVLVAMLRRKR